MAGAYWCMVEDDRQGAPKKVMAEVLGEASRLAAGAGAQTEAVWVTDKATPEGLKQLGEWGAKRIWLLENAAFAPYRAEVWTPAVAELAGKESPQAIFAPVTTRQREFMARLAARLGAQGFDGVRAHYSIERSTDRQFPPRRALHRPKLARIGHRNLLANCELAHPVHPKARATRSPKWRSRCVYQPTFERRSAGGQSCTAALKPRWPPSGWFSMCSGSQSPFPHRSYRAQ